MYELQGRRYGLWEYKGYKVKYYRNILKKVEKFDTIQTIINN